MDQRGHYSFHFTKALLHRLVRWGFVVFGMLGSVCLAQPQAPVVWGEARYFGSGCPVYLEPRSLAMLGDTLVFAGESIPGPTMTLCSLDNGLTWGPRQRLDSLFDVPYMSVFGSGNRIYSPFWYFDTLGYAHCFTRRSLDGGQTWQITVPNVPAEIPCGVAAGLQVMLIRSYEFNNIIEKRSTMSTDGGDNWLPEVIITNEHITAYALAVTQNHFILIGDQTTSNPAHSWSTTTDRTAQNWTPYQELPGQPISSNGLWRNLAGDTTSDFAVLLRAYERSGQSGYDLYIRRTTDGGQSWDTLRALTNNAGSGYFSYAEMFCRGNLFAVAWADWVWGGIYWRLSANHGKDWYPAQRVYDIGLGTEHTCGQFVGNQVRLYWNAGEDSCDYRTISGSITPDAVPPDISMGVPLADEIPPGSEVQFLASATDNDSLPYIQTVLRKQDSIDSIIVPLTERISPTDYRGFWQVPNDTAL
jgi:hypothetical protein